jgi:hypothetical protein
MAYIMLVLKLIVRIWSIFLGLEEAEKRKKFLQFVVVV